MTAQDGQTPLPVNGEAEGDIPEWARGGGNEGADWFVELADRGQSLLDQGEASQAREVFQSALDRLEPGPSYRRAVTMERLGRCIFMNGAIREAAGYFQRALEVTEALAPTSGVKALQGVLESGLGDTMLAIGDLSRARKAYEAAVAIATSLGDQRAQGIDLDHLGVVALRHGRLAEAQQFHQAALKLFEASGEALPQGVCRHHLGCVSEAAGRREEAEAHYREAARLREACCDWSGAAQTLGRLAALSARSGRPDAAETSYRNAVEIAARTRNAIHFRRHAMELARFLNDQLGREGEAMEVAEQALATLTLETYAPDVWAMYGTLADISDNAAALAEDDAARAAHEEQAETCRHIEQYGPRLHATLAALAPEPGYARALIMGRLGRCFLIGGRPALAAAFISAALGLAGQLAAGDDVTTLQRALESDLGEALLAAGRPQEARQAYERALALAEAQEDRRAHAASLERLLALGDAVPEETRPRYRAALEKLRESPQAERAVTVHEEVVTECAFDADLLVDVACTSKSSVPSETPAPLADDIRPMLHPCVRTWVDDAGAARFCLPVSEPAFDRHADCVVMRKTRREVAVAGEGDVLWPLIRAMDGARTAKQLLAALPEAARVRGAHLLAVLAACGVVDTSGRTLGRFVHAATKKGVLLGGGLAGAEVLQLATDGGYRTYAGAARIALTGAVPDKLASFQRLTRARRSRRDYAGRPLTREDFDALLSTACGVTGDMPWEGRDIKLRAYPSSGALYAVEIYPVVLRVDGMEPGVYHYVAGDNALEAVAPGVGAEAIVGASLPVERQMVSGAAAMICLVGEFPRHERKYGEGGYRMMVAEAGHVSQNLVLAATALGLAARPFGGVFDGLMNRCLHLNDNEQQFLLAVLVGHAGEVSKDDKS
jgi:SagB-type dehydrogenase family enzyme